MSQAAHQAGAYPVFVTGRELEVFLLAPGWVASSVQDPSTRTPGAGTHLYTGLGRERHRETKVSCPRTQHNVSD